tara:strand:- start:167 stop:367 length:201 start_codon:yes stop_codon:yes gene_type:complete
MRRLKNIVVALNMLVAAVLGARRGMTISTYAYYSHSRRWVDFIDSLFRDTSHCENSFRTWLTGRKV